MLRSCTPLPPECRKLKILQNFEFRKSTYERPHQKWVCGRLSTGEPCRIGPDGRGRCQANFACVPAKFGDTWSCRRPESAGGPCASGPGPDGTCCNPIPRCEPTLSLDARRGRAVLWFVTIAIGFLALIFSYPLESVVLTPGPLTASHSSLSNCSACHSNVEEGQFGWLHSIFAETKPGEMSSACLQCHQMSTAALNPHGLALDELEKRTKGLHEIAAASTQPFSLKARDALFPREDVKLDTKYCATCHKEHNGVRFPLADLSNAQCQSCHAVQFSSFTDGHPKFDTYPFNRRTRIIFDHNSHFKTHFPAEAEKLGASVSVFGDKASGNKLGKCGNCHVPGAGARQMIVKTFEETCASCHLGQIVGTEQSAGPSGIPLFSLPGLDLDTLRERQAEIGEWPEGALDYGTKASPLLNLLLGADEEGRNLMRDLKMIDLLDLRDASDGDIDKVIRFVWSVKGLLYTLSAEKISDSYLVKTFLAELNREGVDRGLLAELAGSIPRDVWVGAQRDWLPNLQEEIARKRKGLAVPMPAVEPEPLQPPSDAATTGDEIPPSGEQPDILEALEEDSDGILPAEDEKANSTDGEEILAEDTESILADDDADAGSDILASDDEEADGDILGEDDTSGELDTGDLLNTSGDDKSDDGTAEKEAEATPLALVDAEQWAELGGWYRLNYEIRYKPVNHKDSFLRAWLNFAGHLYGKAYESLADPVFKLLSSDTAPGRCATCHSIDISPTKSLWVNWAPLSVSDVRQQFTRFSHEPHFSIMDDRGCLTCHSRDPEAQSQATYKQLDPAKFNSNFKAVDRELCRSCHTDVIAGQDCQLCHVYHVNTINTRHMATTTANE